MGFKMFRGWDDENKPRDDLGGGLFRRYAEENQLPPSDARGNPNPRNFIILKHEVVGRFVILEVKYPDCTNFEGIKILVFRDIPLHELLGRKELDPHFSRSKSAPIARFSPQKTGWALARKFCTAA